MEGSIARSDVALDVGAEASDALSALIARQRPGFCLEQPFYGDPEIYRRDLERIFMRHWLYVGHVSELPWPGDYFVFELAGESVIVVRGHDREVRALANVCRHRGSRVCWDKRGTAKTFLCPYHGWVYDLDGGLRGARLMPEDFDKSRYGLKPLRLEVLHGLMFLNFDDEAPTLGAAAKALDASLKPFCLAEAKVACSRLYPIAANWKLSLENYLECYHCAPAHPEYARSHSLKLPHEQTRGLQAELDTRAAAVGLATAKISRIPSGEHLAGPHYFYDRHPLFEGYLTGSEDGKPLAPLLGDIPDFDGGASNLQVGPVTFGLIYSDHAVIYVFTPRGPLQSDCLVVWLVRGDAVEGRDYDLDRLTWLWDVTTKADKAIIEHNQQGVSSRFYQPGPYSPMESFPIHFVDWYLKTIQ
ncbi:MAG: aromatic ring-hydroxylating dioxygenase subunit alpha [Kiloniellales bacterium]